MSRTTDFIQLEVSIQNDQARKSMRLLDEELKQAKKDLKKLTEGTEEYAEKSKRIEAIQAQLKNLEKQIGITGLTMRELISKQKTLNAVLNNMDPNLPKYKAHQKELIEINARISELRRGAKVVEISLGKMADGFNRYFAMGSAVVAAFAGTMYTIKQFITSSGELSDSLADIQKTTKLSAEEVENLNTQLGKIDTRTSRQDLRQMAVVAGQLGISQDQIYGFVESIDKLNVALGDEITGGAEEVAKTMGTLRNVLTDMKSTQVDQDMLRIGNAVNELGAAGFATAPVIADFANRIGGIGIPLGLTSDQVLGLSATLQELNVSTERGGTAITKILQKMTTNTSDFAKIAGMPLKEFTDLVNQDLMGAFTKVVEGSKRGGQSATLLGGIIKELEVQGAGASEVFAKLSGNTEMLKEKIDLAGSSLASTDSIMNEFNVKNATLGATLDKLSKEFYKLITLQGVQEFFKGIVYGAVQVIEGIRNIPAFIDKYRAAIVAIIGVSGYWLAAETKKMQVRILNNLLLKEGIGLTIKKTIAEKASAVQNAITTAFTSRAAMASKLAAFWQWAWNTAILANPLGAFILLITGAITAVTMYEKNSADAVKREREKIAVQNQAIVTTNKLEEANKKIAQSVEHLNTLSAQEKQDLKDKIDLNLKMAQSDLKVLQMKAALIESDNKRVTYWETWKAVFSSATMDEYAAENGKKAAEAINEQASRLKDNIKNLYEQKQNIDSIMNAESTGDKIIGKSMDQLEAKLSKYQSALKGTEAGSDAYLRIKAKIAAVNKELAKFQSESTGDDKSLTKSAEKQKKLSENYQQLMDEMNAMDAKHLGEKLSQSQKEIIATQQKYDTLIEKAKKFIADNPTMKQEQKINIVQSIDNLEAERDAAVKSIMVRQEEEYTKDIIAIRNKMRMALLSDYEREIEEINAVYDEKIRLLDEQQRANEEYFTTEIVNAQDNEVKLEQILVRREQAYKSYVDRVNAYEGQKQVETAAKKKSVEDKVNEHIAQSRAAINERNLSEQERQVKRIDDTYMKLITDAEQAGMDTSDILLNYFETTEDHKRQLAKATWQEIIQFAIAETQVLSDTFFNILNDRRSQASEAKIADLNKQKQQELSNKNLTEEQKKKIEDKYSKLEAAEKTKVWKSEQKAAAAQAVINGALAITNIWATTPKVDFGVSTMLLIAASIASTVAQLATITSQKPPQFQIGGFTGKGRDDQPAGVVHANEYVIPAKLMEDPLVQKYVQEIELKRTGSSQTNVSATDTNVNRSSYVNRSTFVNQTGYNENGSYSVTKELLRNSTVSDAVSIIDQVRINQSILETVKLTQVFDSLSTKINEQEKTRIDQLNAESKRTTEINQENKSFSAEVNQVNLSSLDQQINTTTNQLNKFTDTVKNSDDSKQVENTIEKELQKTKIDLLDAESKRTTEINQENNKSSSEVNQVNLSSLDQQINTTTNQLNKFTDTVKTSDESKQAENITEKQQILTNEQSIVTEKALLVTRDQEYVSKNAEIYTRDQEYVSKKAEILTRSRDEKVMQEISRQIESVNRERENVYSNNTKTDATSSFEMSKSVVNVTGTQPSFSVPDRSYPASFNLPEIEKAIRLAPMQAMYEFSGKQTQEIIQKLMVQFPKNDTRTDGNGLAQALEKLVMKMSSLDQLNDHLSKGIKATAPIVWTDLEEAQKTMDEMKKDTSVSFR
ncbi:MAG: phage tail tape measure protein [Bacteroidales bacterium]